MTRKETTTFLSDLLISKKFGGPGKYWAREVSIDPWVIGKAKRVDFMQFIPENQCSIGAIEKGIFVCYEIKSCIRVYSGNGLNFLGEKNYIVTTMECYKKLIVDMNEGKFWRHLKEDFPESSSNIGVMVRVPFMKTIEDELQCHPFNIRNILGVKNDNTLHTGEKTEIYDRVTVLHVEIRRIKLIRGVSKIWKKKRSERLYLQR